MQGELSEVILILVGSTTIILLLIGLVVFALFISQKRKFLYRQELIELKYANEQEILRTQIETQVQTFQTISQELHDNVGTLISIAIVHLRTASETSSSDSGSGKKNLRESGLLLEEALDILRDISRSMNPENISRQGLDFSFRNELERLKRTKVFKTEYVSQGSEFPIPSQHQIVILRIFQETLNNILKHSGGNSVSVKVNFESPFLDFIIQDNGHGFDLDSLEHRHNRSGILNMRKRAKIMGASLHIESELGKGTRVQLVYNHVA